MEELFERFETIHFILSHKFASWKGSLSPAEFDYFLTFLTNIAIFDSGQPDPSTVLVIQGDKCTGKSTLAKQIWAIFPTLCIFETMEQVTKQPNVICLKYTFYSEEEQEKYFSMEPQPLLMGNKKIFDDETIVFFN
jgi:deoxyadenosine/deoxycytidine kinase